MAFINDFREQLIKGLSIKRTAWPKGYHVKALPILPDEGGDKIGRALVLFQTNPKNEISAKQYTPVWPDIVADDWELITQ